MKSKQISGFSLMELMMVIAIISVLTAIAVPSVMNLGRAHKLSAATQALVGEMDYARQMAASRNRTVELRLYKLPRLHSSSTQPESFRGFQTFIVEKGVAKPLNEVKYLPSPVVISPHTAVSSLLDPALRPLKNPGDLANVHAGIAGLNYEAAILKFTPGGATDLIQNQQWYLSLVLENDPVVAKNLPANYATIQIDPFNGRALVYRPN